MRGRLSCPRCDSEVEELLSPIQEILTNKSLDLGERGSIKPVTKTNSYESRKQMADDYEIDLGKKKINTKRLRYEWHCRVCNGVLPFAALVRLAENQKKVHSSRSFETHDAKTMADMVLALGERLAGDKSRLCGEREDGDEDHDVPAKNG